MHYYVDYFYLIIRDCILHIVLHFHLLRFDDFLINADASQFDELFIKSHLICTLFNIKSFLIFISFFLFLFFISSSFTCLCSLKL